MHAKNSARWIGLPGRKYKKDDGTESYTPVIEFETRVRADRFRDAVLEAIDAAAVLR